MLLVDTSVWVSHFRRRNPRLEDLLSFEFVFCHPLIIGELACGHMPDRGEILSHLQDLPMAASVSNEEILVFIEKNRLMGKGLSFIDVHLLAATILTGLSLWTEDRLLQKAAHQLGILHR